MAWECNNDPEWRLFDKAREIHNQLAGKNDLEAMAQIVEAANEIFGTDQEGMLESLSRIFIGVRQYGPGTALSAVLMRIQGVRPLLSFSDTGFHDDFRDDGNQVFHVWSFLAETLSPGQLTKGMLGQYTAFVGNSVHEIYTSLAASVAGTLPVQIPWISNRAILSGGGTSWQDYYLSLRGMTVGFQYMFGLISPGEFGNAIRQAFGDNGNGSYGLVHVSERIFGKLYGSP